MRVTPKLPKLPKTGRDFITQYLSACGVEDIEAYLKPDEEMVDNPFEYTDIGKGIRMLKEGLEAGKKIGVVCDSDMDGCCSASLIINFLKFLGLPTPTYYIHSGKQHGVNDIDEKILTDGIELLIIPDAGSNEASYMLNFVLHGMNVIILDHHQISEETAYVLEQDLFKTHVALINPNRDEYTDNRISGTAVTWQFVRAYCDGYEVELPYYLDLVGPSTVSDVMDVTAPGNRYFLEQCLTNKAKNPLLKGMLETKLRKGMNQKGLGWDICPLFNAVCRGSDMETKDLMFKAMIGEADVEEAIKAMARAHSRQTKEVKRIQEEIEPDMDTRHKVNVAFGAVDDMNYLGLCANKLQSAYGKPTFVLRDWDENTWSGSLRSPFPIASMINSCEIESEATGHEEAAGVLIPKANLEDLLNELDKKLRGFVPELPVTACVKPTQVKLAFASLVKKYERLWGHGLPEPTLYIKGKCDSTCFFVFRKRTNTVKFVIDGLECVKFMEKDKEAEKIEKLAKRGKTVEVECVISVSENTWQDETKVQGIIEWYKIKEVKEKKEAKSKDLF